MTKNYKKVDTPKDVSGLSRVSPIAEGFKKKIQESPKGDGLIANLFMSMATKNSPKKLTSNDDNRCETPKKTTPLSGLFAGLKKKSTVENKVEVQRAYSSLEVKSYMDINK